MDSPQTLKRKSTSASEATQPKVNSTPKNRRSSVTAEKEFDLYNVHRESSPNFRAGQDVLEIGWGDSPEPLNVDSKLGAIKTSITCKKKLETKESPKSSFGEKPFKRRNIRSIFNISSKSIIDVSKYVAEVQELSKNVMKEFNVQNTDKDLLNEENLICNNHSNENNLVSRLSSVQKTSSKDTNEIKNSNGNSPTKDHLFDNVLESFINEKDDWLSQALLSHELIKTPLKANFVKSKSENELTLPHFVSLEKQCLTQKCKNINNNFRRTSSFDLTIPPNKYKIHNINDRIKINKNDSNMQYSFQEIEKKRLEAKYRKERREIERKKLEALKKLEMKKLRVIKT